MRHFTTLLLTLLTAWIITSLPVQAAHRGTYQAVVSQTPVLQDMTINWGEATQQWFGTVNLENLMLVNGSPPAKSFTIKMLTGGTGYWASICDIASESGQTTITTGSANSLDNNCTLATVLKVVGNPGSGYSDTPGDTLALNNGACVTVTQVVTDPDTKVAGQIVSFSQGHAPTSTAAYAIGNATIVSSNANCTTSTSGTGATFTYTYFGKAQTPVLTGTGRTNHSGYTPQGGCGPSPATACAPNLAAATFQVVGIGNDGSSSAAKTLSINLIPDACNMGSYDPKLFDAADNCGWGSTAGLQALRTNARNCTTGGSSVCDVKLLLSTGGTWSNPNTSVCCGQPVQKNWNAINYGTIVSTASGTASVTDHLYVGLASTATGSVLVAATGSKPAVYAFDTSAGGTIDAATSFDHLVPNGQGTCGTTWIDFNHIPFGGTPNYNYIIGDRAGFEPAQSCNWWLTNPKFEYAATFSNGLMTANASSPTFAALDLGAANNTALISQAQFYNAAECVVDGATTVPRDASQVSVAITIQSLYCARYSNNGLTPAQSTITWNDIYMVGPTIYPLNPNHPDDSQLNNQATTLNSVWNRVMVMQAGGNAQTDGIYQGNSDTSGNVPKGMQYHGLLWTGNSLFGAFWQGGDNTGSQPLQLTDYTLWRQQPPVGGSNGPNPDWGQFAGNNPTNGQVMKIGVGCHADAGYATCLASEAVYTITFVTGAPGADQVQIGGSLQATLTNLATLVGTTSTPGTCAGVTFGAISNAYAAYSLAHGGTGKHFCMQPPSGGTINGIYIDDPAVNANVYYPLCDHSYTPGTTCNQGTWFATQFVASENSYLENGLPVDSTSHPGTTNNLGPVLSLNNETSFGATCSGVYWCANGSPMLIDKGATFDIFSGTNNYYTVAALRAGLNASYFNFTVNNAIFANEYTCAYQGGGGNPGLCSYYGQFQNDTTNNGAEQQLEAKNNTYWFGSSPATITAFYLNTFTPKASGPLDLGGGSWIGSFTGAGLWNDGSGHAPGYDFNGTGNYAFAF